MIELGYPSSLADIKVALSLTKFEIDVEHFRCRCFGWSNLVALRILRCWLLPLISQRANLLLPLEKIEPL